MRKVKVLKYEIRKPNKYRLTYNLEECFDILELPMFGFARQMKKVKSYKSEKELMNYISENKIDLQETVEFEVR